MSTQAKEGNVRRAALFALVAAITANVGAYAIYEAVDGDFEAAKALLITSSVAAATAAFLHERDLWLAIGTALLTFMLAWAPVILLLLLYPPS